MIPDRLCHAVSRWYNSRQVRVPMSTQKILLVDDEEDILEFLELILEEQGYSVVRANSGRQALEAAQLHRPELILLDIMMPEMDGWEVLKLLKADEEVAHIPVAMLTARTEMKDKIQGIQEGAIDYICKPFATKELLEKLNVIFAQVRNK
jgi:DNA-binding response OmpR family regulator